MIITDSPRFEHGSAGIYTDRQFWQYGPEAR